ncbi:MAG TPA: AAA family ATPase [Verrucomicrobiae bacterium]|nr:AAA family ATPase [Verrucomicrobiae bacterium]
MARLIFVLGHPGTGKSTSLHKLKNDEVAYITATGKELPFRNSIKAHTVKSMEEVVKMIQAAKKPIVVIDDVNYLFTKEVFGASEKTDKWDVYDKISKDFYKIVQAILNKDTEQNFYLFGHLEDLESKTLALKTLGQATRKNNNPEGWTNIVFQSAVELDEFVFKVKTDGTGVKSPMDMFDAATVPNDLKVVNDKINAYYKGDKK